jgi:hypothetical protein
MDFGKSVVHFFVVGNARSSEEPGRVCPRAEANQPKFSGSAEGISHKINQNE